MAEVLNVTERRERGTSQTRRLRRAGITPAILYGQGRESVSVSVPTEEVATAIRHGAKLVNLAGSEDGSALIREVQWDALGIDVLHLDLIRVSATDEVEVTVPLELRGEAPGVKSGGQLQHMIHELTVRCPAASIPDRLEANINSLELDGTLTLAEVELPPDVQVDGDLDAIVVQCPFVEEQEEEEEVVTGDEPEVIGRKPDDEEGEG